MMRYIKAVAVPLFLLWAIACEQERPARERLTVEDQIAELVDCGLTLNGENPVESVTAWDGREELEGIRGDWATFGLLLMGMSLNNAEGGDSPSRAHFVEVLSFDMESLIEYDYEFFLRDIELASHGEFQIDFVESAVDQYEETASLLIDIDGVRIDLDPAFDGDWYDVEVFLRIGRLLKEHTNGLGLYSIDNGSQLLTLLVADKGVIECLKRRTMLDIEQLH